MLAVRTAAATQGCDVCCTALLRNPPCRRRSSAGAGCVSRRARGSSAACRCGWCCTWCCHLLSHACMHWGMLLCARATTELQRCACLLLAHAHGRPQLYENVYLLVEGCCAYSSGCCPSPNPSHHHWQAQQQPEDVFGLSRCVSLPDPLPEASELSLADALKQRTQPSTAAASVPAAAAAAAVPSTSTPGGMPPQPSRTRMFRSGNVFSLGALNVFGVYIGFDTAMHGSLLEVRAETDCLLYRCAGGVAWLLAVTACQCCSSVAC